MRHTGKILLLLALAAGAAGYFFLSNRPLEVRTVEVRRGRAAEIVYASGVVEPVQWAKVSSVLRERIVEVCNCEGQTVAPEDQLAKLDTSEPLAALRELEAKAAFARQELRRIVELYGTGTTTRQVYDKAAADVQAAYKEITETAAKARPDARFMHCLPVRRGVAVTDRILDGPRSVVIHEAQNRMWGQMAVVYQMMGPGA